MYTYVYVYIYIYTCDYIYIYIHIIYLFIYIYIYIYTHVRGRAGRTSSWLSPATEVWGSGEPRPIRKPRAGHTNTMAYYTTNIMLDYHLFRICQYHML